MSELSFVKNFYREHLRRYGKEDIRGMGWHNEEEYSLRFDILTHILSLEGKSILDVGCGYGGLYKYLISSGIKGFNYLGIDILPEMVAIAKEKNPTGKFKVANILNDDLGKFDYVVCIGSMNIKESHEFEDYFFEIIKKSAAIAKKGVLLNFLSERDYLAPGPYHFVNAENLKKSIEKMLGLKVEVIENELLLGESFVLISTEDV